MRALYNMIKYALADWRLQKEVKQRYYRDQAFFHLDRALLNAYVFKNPYAISKNYLKKHNRREIHTYGETPLMTYEKIAKETGLEPTDIFLELGSGRGRGALFLHHFFKCEVIGLERIPQFVKLSRYLSRRYQQRRVTFICGDMLKEELPKATVVYLYGTALSDQEIALLVEKLKKYPRGIKIASVSYPLTDYDKKAFCVEKTFPISFLWGETMAYIQTVCHYE